MRINPRNMRSVKPKKFSEILGDTTKEVKVTAPVVEDETSDVVEDPVPEVTEEVTEEVVVEETETETEEVEVEEEATEEE